MNIKYYGIYTSTQAGVTGCVKQFMSQPIEGMQSFPPQVDYECDLCSKRHGFRFKTSYMTSTQRQEEAMKAYAVKENIESNVKIPYLTR